MADFGISVALLTPFRADGSIDTERLAAHARDVIARGARGVTLFGTTGENASIGTAERAAGIAGLRDAGIPPERIILGLCANAMPDLAVQARQGRDAGIRDFLLPPPSYFKGLSEDGLFDWHVQAIAATGEGSSVILYHIPQVTGVPLTVPLVARLDAAFPGRLRALKDSSGDWATATAFLDSKILPVLVGDERLLHRAVAIGCAGAISGMANLHPERLVRLVGTATEDVALSEETSRVVACPVIPAIKVLLAAARSDPDWERVRPPLAPLPKAARATLVPGATVPAGPA